MRHILTIIATISMCTPAHAQKAKVLPPEEYDHPYEGWLVYEKARSQQAIRERCPQFNFNLGVALACTFRRGDDMCLIVIVPDDQIRAAGHDPDTVRRHEIGHCNGWPADHRGAR